jgi:hypothetical protein
LRDLQRGRSPGRKRAETRCVSREAEGDERELPNKVDKQRLSPGRLHPELPIHAELHLPLRERRRIRFACRLWAICSSAVGRSRRWLSTRSGRFARARHGPTESRLPVETVQDERIWTPLPDGVPPLLLKDATTVSGPARKEERIGHQPGVNRKRHDHASLRAMRRAATLLKWRMRSISICRLRRPREVSL